MYAQVLIAKEDKRWTVKEHALVGFTLEQAEKHRKAQRLLEMAVNSWEFRQEVLSLEFTSNRGMSNKEIYQLVMDGSEVLSPEVDNEADINVEAYNSYWSRVVGYTYEDTPMTWINLKFFNAFDYADIADNLFHEWLHKLGFDHESADEDTSVPYALGDVVNKLVKRLIQGEKLHDVNEVDAETEIILTSQLPSKPDKREVVCYRSWRTLFFRRCYYL